MWSSSRPVVAIHPLPTVRFTSGRPRPLPGLQEACRRFPIAILAIHGIGIPVCAAVGDIPPVAFVSAGAQRAAGFVTA
jgi:hypothetical protein